MRANDELVYVAFRVRVTAPNGAVAEGECFAVDESVIGERVRQTVIDLVRTGAERWEFACDQAS